MRTVSSTALVAKSVKKNVIDMYVLMLCVVGAYVFRTASTELYH